MIPHKQLKLADIFEDCKNIFEEDKPQFLYSRNTLILVIIFLLNSITIFMHQRDVPVNTL